MKRGAPNHPKMKALARALGIPLPMAVGMMEMLWHFAGQYAPAGDIGRFEDEHIEEECGWHEWRRHRSCSFIEAAVKTGWLEKNEAHRLLVHDWPEHCDDAIHMRLARSRERFADGSAPKVSRLPKVEKVEAEKFYASLVAATPESHAVRTESSRRVASQAPPKPSLYIGVRAHGSNTQKLELDEAWTKFIEAWNESGFSQCSEFDWQEARQFGWNALGFELKLAAVAGVRDRAEVPDDPARKALPKNYLAKRMWTRGIQCKRKATESLEDMPDTDVYADRPRVWRDGQ